MVENCDDLYCFLYCVKNRLYVIEITGVLACITSYWWSNAPKEKWDHQGNPFILKTDNSNFWTKCMW